MEAHIGRRIDACRALKFLRAADVRLKQAKMKRMEYQAVISVPIFS